MPASPNPPPALPRSGSQPLDLAGALSKSFDLPLRAIRATIEELARSLSPPDTRLETLDGLLDEVRRLAGSVQQLVDYAQPPSLQPVECTLPEIAATTRALVSKRDRSRLIVACDPHSSVLCVDSLILTRALSRLAANALEASSDSVLLSLRTGGGASQAMFQCGIVNACTRAPLLVHEACAPFNSAKANRLGLGLSLAERDLHLLGGTLISLDGAERSTLVVAQLPATPLAAKEQAA